MLLAASFQRCRPESFGPPSPRDPPQNSVYSPERRSVRHLPALHRTARGCARAPAAAQPAPSPLPKRSAVGQPWCSSGQPSSAAPVTTRCPPTLPPSPGPKRGVSHGFRGPSRVPAPGPPQWLLLELRFPHPTSGSPELLTSLRFMGHRGPR